MQMCENKILFMYIDREYMKKANILRGHPIDAFSHGSVESLIWLWRQAYRCSLSSGVNVYWSRKTWPCKFWFVCVCCLVQSSCRVESITIGMRTWLLERLWKSHRPMIKNSVQASLQPHHSGCLHKGTVHCKKKKKTHIAGLVWHNRLNLALSQQIFLHVDHRNTFKFFVKDSNRI